MNGKKIGLTAMGLLCLFAAHSGFSWGQENNTAPELLQQAQKIDAPPAPEGKAPQADNSYKTIEWVPETGGTFTMGTYDYINTRPIKVTVEPFDISRTLVTVNEYKECVSKGTCKKPRTGESCNWDKTDRDRGQDPINCVSWDEAIVFANFVGGGARLLLEKEYEWAARHGNNKRKYPWGNEPPSCDRVVMQGNGGFGCGQGGTMPVCSKHKGDSLDGLCDLSGNLWEMLQDTYYRSFKGETDGLGEGAPQRVVRGGCFHDFAADEFRSDYRKSGSSVDPLEYFGFRLARSRG